MAKATAEQMAKITEWQKENVKQYTIRFNREMMLTSWRS